MNEEVSTMPTKDEDEASLSGPEAEVAAGEEEEEDAPEQHASNRVDLEKMKDAVFFLYPDRNTRLSKFWILMILSSVIATSGVASDSAATVIGAMIVAPLMTPILGTMLAIVLGDGRNFLFCLMLVLTGAGSAILIGYLYGLPLSDDIIAADNNSQISGRVQPKITDLIGALATGAVGSIALVRQDIAGSLPGVAISISLVPPLCVVGLTLSNKAGHDAAGAMLLFATNFACILAMGVVVMFFYRVPRMVVGSSRRKRDAQRFAILTIIALLAVVAVPLGITSKQLRDIYEIESCLEDAANEWGNPQGWNVTYVVTSGKFGQYSAVVTVTGEPPFPNSTDFPQMSPMFVALTQLISFSIR